MSNKGKTLHDIKSAANKKAFITDADYYFKDPVADLLADNNNIIIMGPDKDKVRADILGTNKEETIKVKEETIVVKEETTVDTKNTLETKSTLEPKKVEKKVK